MANTITSAEYKNIVRWRIGDDEFNSGLLTQFANDTNREICNGAMWPFMEETFAGTVTSGTATYNLPSDFQTAINLTLTDPDNNAIFLDYVDNKQFTQDYPDPSALNDATPEVWTSFGSTFTIGPAAPDQNYTLALNYLKVPTTITEDGDTLDVPDEFSEVVVLGMLHRALMANDYYDQAQVIAQNFDIQLDRMKQRLLRRQTGQSPRIRTGRTNKRDWLTW